MLVVGQRRAAVRHITTLKSSIMASRAVDSQQTLVLVPAISTVSMPMPRSTRSSCDEPGISAL